MVVSVDDRRVGEIIAKFAGKRPDEIEEHLSLGSLGVTKSLGLSMLRSSIQAKFGVELPSFSTDTTVAQLVRLANGGSSTQTASPALLTVPSAAPRPPAPSLGIQGKPSILGLGLDLQEIGILPVVSDFRADSFYAAHFAPAELATAVLRADPRAHLCGVFCLKEAAKKSHPALLDVKMTDFLVFHDGDGRPSLRVLDLALAQHYVFAISITHTGRYAAATCLTMVRAA